MKKGYLIGFPIVGVRVVLEDGQSHPVDSSDVAFQTAAREAFRQAYNKAKPQILEPIMKVSVEGPSEFAGNVFASINQRRGIISQFGRGRKICPCGRGGPSERDVRICHLLRSLTQGKAEYTMEFLKYGRVPAQVAEELMAEYREKQKTDRRRE